tara:strand:+ start:4411 stop:5238 length:828 start_codon:yes stop_codon:yes gene_type:complete
MKIKHNKKRNTAFVFESLIKEITLAILKEDAPRKDKAVSIVRKHFAPDSILSRQLQCYRSLYENQNTDRITSEKIMRESKMANRLIDPDGLFKSQTSLIKDINKELDPSIFNNFVPNYKTLATIDQIFSGKLSPRNTIILENQIISNMIKPSQTKDQIETIDDLAVTSFIKKFNTKYEGGLLENQKSLLNHYISSFSDNSLSLKMFLNEELLRLKTRLKEALEIEEIRSDEDMLAKAGLVIQKLDEFKNCQLSDTVVLTVLKTQQLEKEIFNNDN